MENVPFILWKRPYGLFGQPKTCCTTRAIFKSIKNTFIGAAIKDTRTKSRGRVELGEGGGTGWGGVEGRGENADNCN